MIVGIGIDVVDIDRFDRWQTYSLAKLQRIFTVNEIEYCLQEPRKSAERFAARFAAREALWKALSQAGVDVPFLLLCRQCTIVATKAGPCLSIKEGLVPSFHILLSISHSIETACALVMLQTVP